MLYYCPYGYRKEVFELKKREMSMGVKIVSIYLTLVKQTFWSCQSNLNQSNKCIDVLFIYN